MAKLLQFEAVEQACIAAGAFAIAVQAMHEQRGRLCLQVERKALAVFAQSTAAGPTLTLEAIA